ncbi:MAG: hypothetical protein IKH88_12640 [Prevotella sp.]|nr:hypothetical protein [Prevotella sp.]
MLNIIQNNPYRFLGVCSNAPTAERVANTRRLNAFLKVNKVVSFPLDLDNLMPSLTRTADGLNAASSSINLPMDQFKYALFWFIKVSPIDKMALDYLQKGDTAKAQDLFSKKENCSSLLNQGVLAFITGNDGQGIKCMTKLLHNGTYRNELVKAICGSTFQISEEEAVQLFIDTLLEERNIGQLKKLFEQYGCSSEDNNLLRGKSIDEPIAAINSAVAQAKNVSSKDPEAVYQAGLDLMNSTKDNLQAIRSILGTSDMQYQMVADNLAKQILQCGINYYNNSNEEDEEVKINKAMVLQEYAESIAAGKLLKERCKENTDILRKKKADLPPAIVREETNAIYKELADYCKKPDLISHAVTLLNNTKPYLQAIKRKLGGSDPSYLKISSLVVNNALHNVIEEVNAAQEKLHKKIESQMASAADLYVLKEKLNEAWDATLIMDGFDLDDDSKERYRNNRTALINLRNQVGGAASNVSTAYSGSSGEDNYGWLWGLILLIIIVCLKSC